MNPSLFQQIVRRIDALTERIRQTESNRALYDVANEVSPDEFTSTPQDNLDPQDADILRITMTQATSLTGIEDGRMGRFLELYNASAFTLTLPH